MKLLIIPFYPVTLLTTSNAVIIDSEDASEPKRNSGKVPFDRDRSGVVDVVTGMTVGRPDNQGSVFTHLTNDCTVIIN
jgi:hypothetical protein